MGIGRLIGETIDGAMMFGGVFALAGILGMGGCGYMVYKYNRDINSVSYAQTYSEAKKFADKDGNGFLSLEENLDLYGRAGRQVILAPDKDTEIPRLSTSELERAIASYR